MMYLKQVYQIHYWIQILSIPLPTQFFFISYLASPNSNLHNRKTQSNLSNVNYWNLTWRSIMLHFSGLQLYWKETPTQLFSRGICKIFKNTFFQWTLSVAASIKTCWEMQKIPIEMASTPAKYTDKHKTYNLNNIFSFHKIMGFFIISAILFLLLFSKGAVNHGVICLTWITSSSKICSKISYVMRCAIW